MHIYKTSFTETTSISFCNFEFQRETLMSITLRVLIFSGTNFRELVFL